MESFVESTSYESIGLITALLLLLVVARLLGELMNRMGQSSVVGEILAGVVLGPAVFGLVLPTPELAGISELSVFLILLSAGLEMDYREIVRAFLGRGAILGAVTFFLPMGAGLVLGVASRLNATQSVILALVIAITALPVIIRILSDLKLLDSPVSKYSVATAVFNDIAALFCLGVILALPATQFGFGELIDSVSTTCSKLLWFMLIIVVISGLFHWAGARRGYIEGLLTRVIRLFGKESLFGVAILFALIVGSVSEKLSSHFVIGVFFGGLLISREAIGDKLFVSLEDTLNSVTSGFLAPIFFAFIGLNFSVEPLRSFPGILFAVAVIVVSISSKILAGRLGGRWAKIEEPYALGVGVLLNSRGTMDLVVANIALTRGVIGSGIFSTLVLLSVVSTVLSPILFKRLVMSRLRKDPRGGGSPPELSHLGDANTDYSDPTSREDIHE